jgi:stage V sporulation protein S
MDTLETPPSSNGSTEASPSPGSQGAPPATAAPSTGRSGRPAIEVLKVSATSKPVAVAGAIAGVVRTQSRVEVQAIGAGAINQAVKAIAISRGYVAAGGLDLVCIPSFIDISIDGEERTGIRLLVESR